MWLKYTTEEPRQSNYCQPIRAEYKINIDKNNVYNILDHE